MKTSHRAFLSMLFLLPLAVPARATTTYIYSAPGGLQTFTVTVAGTYDIVAYGAQGGNSGGGNSAGDGAEIGGTVTLAVGDVLDIYVGGEGAGGGGGHGGGGGGGGTFVILDAASTPLIVAGGGGGGGGYSGGGGSFGGGGGGGSYLDASVLDPITYSGVNTGDGEVTVDYIVPEPSSFVLFVLGLLAIPAFRRCRKLRS
jgi:hypothetical protein